MVPQPERQQQQLILTVAPGLTESDISYARVSMQMNAEPGTASLDASSLNASASEDVADDRVFEKASVKGEEAAEVARAVVDAVESVVHNAVAADGTEVSQNKPFKSSHGDAAVSGTSWPTWRKPSINREGECKPQPVMGAVAWPALAEACNIKASEARKSKGSGLKTPPPLPATASSSIQESASKGPLPSEDGSNPQQGFKHKPPFKGVLTGFGRPAFQPIENGPSSLEHSGSDQSIKQNTHVRTKGSFSANPSMDLERAPHHGPYSNNMRKWRNNRDQGRGSYGWHHHSRGYENAGDMVSLLHEQRIGPRNMPRPHPLMNVNPAFYPVPNFQNGGMYYMPAGAPEFVPPYFPPMAAVGGMMHGPDPLILRSLLLKQIDYYFSIENLCRDVFLRTHMDEQGFVPVSVIARFNRVQTLSPNPLVILEALQQSAVVEVQHDRIRRRNDGGKWRLLPDQVFNDSPGQKSMAVLTSSEGKGRKFVQADKAPFPPSQEASTGIHVVSDMPVERSHSRAERLHGSGSSAKLAARGSQRYTDNSNAFKVQHGSETLLQSGFSELSVSRMDANEAITPSQRDITGHSSANLNTLQAVNDLGCRETVSKNQESLRDARILESSFLASETSVKNETAGWKNSEGFWMENNSYFMHGDFVQDGSIPSDSEFVLKSHQDADEDRAEVNDRDLQRLINATHAPFGSFIAVP